MASGALNGRIVMKLVFLLEERSMKVLLDIILPRILPDSVTFQTIPHQGKSELEKSISTKLRAWNEPNVAFVIVHDQDSNNCVELKNKLVSLCSNANRKFLVRIPCHELEAWYWGDLDAVSKAYGKDLISLKNKKKYRNPDQIENPKQELKKLIPTMGQIEGASKIAPHMNIEENTSYSFQVFVKGVLRLCNEIV